MKEREEVINLFDIYKELLTEKQQNYFKNYYFEDLSLSEISDNLNVSKTMVGKTIKLIENKLYEYESILHNLENKKKLIEIINNIDDNNIKTKLKGLL